MIYLNDPSHLQYQKENQHAANKKMFRQCSLINSYRNGDRSTYIFIDNKNSNEEMMGKTQT